VEFEKDLSAWLREELKVTKMCLESSKAMDLKSSSRSTSSPNKIGIGRALHLHLSSLQYEPSAFFILCHKRIYRERKYILKKEKKDFSFSHVFRDATRDWKETLEQHKKYI
jgi:hypothetical protein